MKEIHFGTDGWRGIIARDFTFQNVRILSQAVSDYCRKRTPGKKISICVGYDARFLSREFAQEVCCVLAANGISVVLSSRDVPTPAVSFFVQRERYDLGIMITASHNPYYFNGFKIKKPNGGAADKQITDAVESLLGKTPVAFIDFPKALDEKRVVLKDITRCYVQFIRQYLHRSIVKNLKVHVLVDVMYGSGNGYLEEVFEGTGVKFSYLRNEFNPSFGGCNPEPIEKNITQLMRAMKTKRYDIGFVLDGDADRLASVLPGGRYVGVQTILPLLAFHLRKNRALEGGIVKTIVGSNLVDAVAQDLGCILYETPVGFKYISSLFETENVLIGGEEAGGLGVQGYIPERDGTMSCSLILEMMGYTKKSYFQLIAELDKKFGRWYYQRISFPVTPGRNPLANLKIPSHLLGRAVSRVNDLDGLKIMSEKSWLMFRASGTEPIVRIYSEALSQKEANQLIELGKKMIHI